MNILARTMKLFIGERISNAHPSAPPVTVTSSRFNLRLYVYSFTVLSALMLVPLGNATDSLGLPPPVPLALLGICTCPTEDAIPASEAELIALLQPE